MKRTLSVGEKITLSSAGRTTLFTIDSVLGAGGTCAAYSVTYYEDGDIPHKGVLKEYCPAFLFDDNYSRESSSIKIPLTCRDAYARGINEFENTYKRINEYLTDNPSATNYHPVLLGLYEGNNTKYTLTSCDYGLSYDKIEDKNLLSICEIALSVTKAVELYHNAGFLHLDIKPKNILILNEVTELIKLFDYDSLTSIEKIKKREISALPLPEDYDVPEIRNFDLHDISIQTDIFEIGAMIFTRVFKRPPQDSDAQHDAVYDLEKNELFNGVSPQAKSKFISLMRKTVQIT